VPDAPPEQGYQLRFSPAELYRVAIREIGEAVAGTDGGRAFHELGAARMDEILTALETGDLTLPSVPSPVFFETLLANTIEGWFADPAYGGNRGMVGWRMVGFPGAYAQYLDLVDQHGIAFEREPVSIADSHARQAHLSAHGK
jgi:gluconate 2-dehydrogenase gamma chain